MRNLLFPLVTILLYLLCMTGIRLGFFYYNNFELVEHPPISVLLRGLRFDLLVSSWCIFPVLLSQLLSGTFSENLQLRIHRIGRIFLFCITAIILIIGISDIFYYRQFASHLNEGSLVWLNNPGEVWGLIWHEKILRFSFFGLIIITAIFVYIHWLISKLFPYEFKIQKISVYPVLALVILFPGMRGGLRAKPLNIADSRISEHYFFNQACINPVFFLYHNLFETNAGLYRYSSYTQLMADSIAQEYIHKSLFPYYEYKTEPNIVFILMESMSVPSLRHTPFLDSLKQNSLYFDSFYSSGEHTYNGIFSTLWPESALMQKHMLRLSENKKFSGIPEQLNRKGYFNMFFIPHNRQFDNLGNFLWKHGFDSVLDNSNFPDHLKGGSVWGTSDHFILDYALSIFDSVSNSKSPFMGVVLTISNHSPYHIPKKAGIPEFNDNSKQAVLHYCDWSIRNFFQKAQSRHWYNNTVFVLLGDHGKLEQNEKFPLPLSMHHIPMIIFGKGIKPGLIHTPGTQQDIFPTLGYLCKFPFSEHALSVNLLNTSRNFACFSSDNYCGLIQRGNFYMLNQDGEHLQYSLEKKTQSPNPDLSAFNRLLLLNQYAAWRIEKSGGN